MPSTSWPVGNLFNRFQCSILFYWALRSKTKLAIEFENLGGDTIPLLSYLFYFHREETRIAYWCHLSGLVKIPETALPRCWEIGIGLMWL